MAQPLQSMFILPVTSGHLSGTTTLTCGRPRQVSLYNTASSAHRKIYSIPAETGAWRAIGANYCAEWFPSGEQLGSYILISVNNISDAVTPAFIKVRFPPNKMNSQRGFTKQKQEITKKVPFL